MSGIYIHFPFCKKKCLYCNFYSIASLSYKQSFIKALCIEIEKQKHYLNSEPISTLYFGGGTPTLFTAKELETIIQQLNHHFKFASQVEFTIEANPEQLSKEYLFELKELGINRLSIGIQSLDDKILQFLGRIHNKREALNAINNAEKAGFNNISIDLIYGILQREKGKWLKELNEALHFPIQHLSAYSLTVEENTLLSKKIANNNLLPPDEEQAIEEFNQTIEQCSLHGFEQYEISNYAQKGYYSKHNWSYWHEIPYLGLGPSAHSYNLLSRQWNVASIQEYIKNIQQGLSTFSQEELTSDMRFNEKILLSLRVNEGISLEEISTKFGIQYAFNIENYFQNISKELYTINNHHISLSNKGKLVADKIAEELFII